MGREPIVPVSVVVPVKNEERNLARCLTALRDYDDVLVVDSGSTDQTQAIAAEFGVRVVDFQWDGGFPKKRNWVLRNVPLRNDWVLFLDADEVVSADFNREVSHVVTQSTYNGFWITYRNYFMGRLLRHGDPMRKLALFRVGAGEYEHIHETSWTQLDMEVHEHPVIQGQVGRINTPVTHHDYRGYSAYMARHSAYSDWEARRYLTLHRAGFQGLTRRQRLKYRLMGTWWLGPLYFLGAYVFKLGFLDGRAGWLLAMSKMVYFFQIKVKIEELRAHPQQRLGHGNEVHGDESGADAEVGQVVSPFGLDS